VLGSKAKLTKPFPLSFSIYSGRLKLSNSRTSFFYLVIDGFFC